MKSISYATFAVLAFIGAVSADNCNEGLIYCGTSLLKKGNERFSHCKCLITHPTWQGTTKAKLTKTCGTLKDYFLEMPVTGVSSVLGADLEWSLSWTSAPPAWIMEMARTIPAPLKMMLRARAVSALTPDPKGLLILTMQNYNMRKCGMGMA